MTRTIAIPALAACLVFCWLFNATAEEKALVPANTSDLLRWNAETRVTVTPRLIRGGWLSMANTTFNIYSVKFEVEVDGTPHPELSYQTDYFDPDPEVQRWSVLFQRWASEIGAAMKVALKGGRADWVSKGFHFFAGQPGEAFAEIGKDEGHRLWAIAKEQVEAAVERSGEGTGIVTLSIATKKDQQPTLIATIQKKEWAQAEITEMPLPIEANAGERHYLRSYLFAH